MGSREDRSERSAGTLAECSVVGHTSPARPFPPPAWKPVVERGTARGYDQYRGRRAAKTLVGEFKHSA